MAKHKIPLLLIRSYPKLKTSKWFTVNYRWLNLTNVVNLNFSESKKYSPIKRLEVSKIDLGSSIKRNYGEKIKW